MSDSFADLWHSTAPSKPVQPTQPRTLGSIQPAAQQRKPQTDVFSMLAAASPANSRSVTPSYVATQPMNKSASTGGTGAARSVQKSSSSGGGDAFSDLFSGSFSSSNGSNLTMAQKAALVEKQKLSGQRGSHVQPSSSTQGSGSLWAGLDALGSSSRATSVSPAPPPDDDWKLDLLQPSPSAQPAVQSKSPQDEDDWGLGDFASKPTSSRPSQTSSQSQSLWDLDEFTSSPSATIRVSPAQDHAKSSTPDSFDFGDREDGLLQDQSGDEDDILGALAKPAQLKPTSSGSSAQMRSTPSPQLPPTESHSRAVSPPPHILGQIVEMGFSPQQARVALAATNTGLDVQAALETLLANGAGADASRRSSPGSQHREREQVRYRDPDEPGGAQTSPSVQRIHPRRERQREPPSRENSAAEGQKNIQDQANELLAQASTIGLSVFNKANLLWKEGKEKVQKVYEERSAASSSSGTPYGTRPTRGSSRPKWMQEAPDDIPAGWADDHNTSGGFADDQDDALPQQPTKRPPPRQRPAEQKHATPLKSAEPDPRRPKTGDLLGDDSPKIYVSPFRRKTPARAPALARAESSPLPPSTAPSPTPLIQRRTVSASPSELATSAKHKATGTEMFKLGRYAEAETAYSYSIAALPDTHLLLVPLYNNRALTRIKTGDHTGAVDDCTAVLKIIGQNYHPAREAKVTNETEGASVDLADAYVKALRRRAEAYEGKEKWEAAKNDWETIVTTEWATRSRTEAIQAAGRCRRILAMNSGASSATSAPPTSAPAKPKPRPKPVALESEPPSEALNRVREANQAAEAEDQEKHALKDSVDSRLLAWKGGKENNLRALIASLDTILWPELGLQKVGMHELVSPSQVKIRYTKAIAKLHPDKLNARNTTLEQRMIANSVFGALNDAWNSFKQ